MYERILNYHSKIILNIYRIRYRTVKIIAPLITDNRANSLMTFTFFWFSLTALERKISVRASRDELVQKGILLPVIRSTSFPENGK